jgi:hypothetical protein
MLRVPGLVRPGSVETITLARHEVPYLQGHDSLRWTVRPEIMPSDQVRRFSRYFGDELRERLLRRRDLDLMELVNAYPGCLVEAVAVAADSYTGSRSVVQAIFGINDFRIGRFVDDTCDHTGVLRVGADDDELVDLRREHVDPSGRYIHGGGGGEEEEEEEEEE